MNHRLLIYALAISFVAGSADTWSQDLPKTAHRRESLIDLFQQRLCGILCDGHRSSKAGCHGKIAKPMVQKAPVQKAPVQKAPVQKAPVQKGAVQKKPLQKGLCWREVSDMAVACTPCGPFPAGLLSGRPTRWCRPFAATLPFVRRSVQTKEGKPRAKGGHIQRSGSAYHWNADPPAPPLLPIPEIEKPHLENPFLDDAIQPAPAPRGNIREATDRSTPRRSDPLAGSAHRPIVQQAAYYDFPVRVIQGASIRPVD